MQNQLKTMLDAKLLQVDMRRFMHLVPFLQFKKREKKTHGGALFSVKLHVEAWNFTKSNTPPWVFFTLFKLY